MDTIKKEGFLEETKQVHKVGQEQRQKDKQQSLFDDVKVWEVKNSSLDGFDVLKVDIISMYDQGAQCVTNRVKIPRNVR
jgi:hypothetical protein